jgi:hypothetical protein
VTFQLLQIDKVQKISDYIPRLLSILQLNTKFFVEFVFRKFDVIIELVSWVRLLLII